MITLTQIVDLSAKHKVSYVLVSAIQQLFNCKDINSLESILIRYKENYDIIGL